ncbi:hypothetical protein GCM10008921_10590 [Metaclostridioides mangenotii]
MFSSIKVLLNLTEIKKNFYKVQIKNFRDIYRSLLIKSAYADFFYWLLYSIKFPYCGKEYKTA